MNPITTNDLNFIYRADPARFFPPVKPPSAVVLMVKGVPDFVHYAPLMTEQVEVCSLSE